MFRTMLVPDKHVGSGDHKVERRTVNREDSGSIPLTAFSKLRQFHLPHICLCLSEETLKAGGPFYLVPGEIKRSHTGGKCVTCSGLTTSRWILNAMQRAPSSI